MKKRREVIILLFMILAGVISAQNKTFVFDSTKAGVKIIYSEEARWFHYPGEEISYDEKYLPVLYENTKSDEAMKLYRKSVRLDNRSKFFGITGLVAGTSLYFIDPITLTSDEKKQRRSTLISISSVFVSGIILFYYLEARSEKFVKRSVEMYNKGVEGK